MTIFYAQYEAIPLPDSDEFGEFGGAYVNCWVEANSEVQASELALATIHERGWKIVSISQEWCDVTENLYSQDDEGRGHYQQAVLDGECYVFHQWPAEAH